MKKTIQNLALGGLASLALMAGSAFADELKKENTPQGEIFREEVSVKLKEQLKEAGISAEKIAEIFKNVTNSTDLHNKKIKVISRAMVIGPDGKLKEAENRDDLSKVLTAIEDAGVKKLLKENENEIISGKVVIIDEDGNRIEKDFGAGSTLDEMLKGTLEGMGLEINMKMGKEAPKKVKSKEDLADKVDKLQKELVAQRLLLETIIKKLN